MYMLCVMYIGSLQVALQVTWMALLVSAAVWFGGYYFIVMGLTELLLQNYNLMYTYVCCVSLYSIACICTLLKTGAVGQWRRGG